jgi:chromosomal replication initiation ATPase DnaA
LRRRVGFAEIVRILEQTLGANARERFAQRGGPGRSLAMWAVRRYGGLSLREAGEALGGMDYAAVSVAIKRLKRKAAASPDLREPMERIGQLLNVET